MRSKKELIELLLEYLLKNSEVDFKNEVHLVCDLYSYLKSRSRYSPYPEFPIKMQGSKKSIDMALTINNSNTPVSFIEIKYGSFSPSKVYYDIKKMNYTRRNVSRFMIGFFNTAMDTYQVDELVKKMKKKDVTLLFLFKEGTYGLSPVDLKDPEITQYFLSKMSRSRYMDALDDTYLNIVSPLVATNINLQRYRFNSKGLKRMLGTSNIVKIPNYSKSRRDVTQYKFMVRTDDIEVVNTYLGDDLEKLLLRKKILTFSFSYRRGVVL